MGPEDEAKPTAETVKEQGQGAAGLKNILKSPITQKDEPRIVPHMEIKEDVQMKMTVLRGRNLEKQKFGKPDPYVILSYGDQVEKSKVVKNNLNPEWSLEKIFTATKNSPKEILLEVYDKDTVTKDDFMGRVCLPLSDIPKLSQGTWIPLKDCKNGEIFLSGEIIPSASEVPTVSETEPKVVKEEGTPAAPIEEIDVTSIPAEKDKKTLDGDKVESVEVMKKVPADSVMKPSIIPSVEVEKQEKTDEGKKEQVQSKASDEIIKSEHEKEFEKKPE